jgi:hypothetical protein
MSELPKNKEEFLSTIEREWTALMGMVARLDETQMSTSDAGGWTPRDNLAHLSEWIKALTGHHMDGRPAHEALNLPLEIVKDWDFDRINPALLQRNRARSTEDVLGELKQLYAALMKRLTAMPFEDLLQPRWPDRADSAPLLAYVLGDTSEHFAEHRETMEKNFLK